jgi:hypothetical protein
MNKLLGASTALFSCAFAVPALAATPPSFSVSCSSAVEGLPVPGAITKNAKASSYSKIRVQSIDGTAKAGVDYVAFDQSFTIGNSQVLQDFAIQTHGNTRVDGIRTFGLKMTIVRNGVGAVSIATCTINDDDVAPVPTPTPPPPPPSGDVLAPSLSGLTSIASNFDTAPYLIGGQPIPASGVPDVVGAFRFICAPGQVLADDPIMFPGQPGKSHLHQFYGNTSANGNSTYSSLRQNGTSSCVNPLNRSAYWMPALLDGKGNVVRPDYISIYYKRRPASDPVVSDPANPRYMGKGVPLPNGLRFIYGWDPTGMNSARTGSAYFNCDGPTAKPGHYFDLPTAFANCPAGNRLGAIILAPDCWDGKRLDSVDHRSHVAYSSYGGWGYLKCDADHPFVIPQFQLAAWYSILAGDDTSKWSLSSDAMAPSQPRGFTLHADWFGAWDNTVMAMWTDNCIDKFLNCSAGDLGNGFRLKGDATAPEAMGWLANPRLVPVPAMQMP